MKVKKENIQLLSLGDNIFNGMHFFLIIILSKIKVLKCLNKFYENTEITYKFVIKRSSEV